MIDRNDPSDLPPRGVRMIIWFGLGILVFAGFNSIERFLLPPEAVGDEQYAGVGGAAAVYLWGMCLGVLLRLFDVDRRDAIAVAGWSMLVACVGFATGVAVYFAVKALAPALLAGFGTLTPLLATVAVQLAGLFLTARAYGLLGR